MALMSMHAHRSAPSSPCSASSSASPRWSASWRSARARARAGPGRNRRTRHQHARDLPRQGHGRRPLRQDHDPRRRRRQRPRAAALCRRGHAHGLDLRLASRFGAAGSQPAASAASATGFCRRQGHDPRRRPFFDPSSVADRAQVAVIEREHRAARSPTGRRPASAGQLLSAGCRPGSSGVVNPHQRGFGGTQNLIRLPALHHGSGAHHRHGHRCAASRCGSPTTLATDLAEQAVTAFLTQRHGTQDFFIVNTDEIRQTITATTADADAAGRRDRGDLARGRRYRRHEHHARLGLRARRRDRRPHGGRRPPRRHPPQFLIEAVVVCADRRLPSACSPPCASAAGISGSVCGSGSSLARPRSYSPWRAPS